MTAEDRTAAHQGKIPIVYTIRGCDSCVKLLAKWDADKFVYDERRVELSQATLDEARQYGKLVPIVVWPDGRVEQGFGDSFGCFI
jgi:glutaredoxin